MTYNEEDVLAFINDVITANGGQESTRETTIVASGIDSFGVAILFLELDDEYGCFPNSYLKEVSDISVREMTIDVIMKRILQCS